ncbi:hypothetical protein DAPPUDRAFT_344140 [Daphnia pulex]|uniref:Uncharacterized protein n=1 Tax=Daphnia pulex TaxID=6669 RepID=E9I6K8_DAPPU|nr:hypothetical protein DAPPUDRAFT_344140 [Daphnia pulex]|eukprot:EFX60372.1 hypothetical protein DAPPUDRAFT_344140 [Daphnia pulex]
MTEVLHMHPALRRTIAQVDRSLRYLRGEEDFANPFNLEPFSLDDYIDAAVERALADDDVGVQPVQQENSSKDGQPLASVQSTSKTCGEGEQLPAKGDEESMMD